MRRLALIALLLGACGATLATVPAAAKRRPSGNTRTPVRFTAPRPADATVVGFRLNLLRTRKASIAAALGRAAASLPKSVTVYAVLGKQKRSDRVTGVLVAANRATALAAARVRGTARTLTVDLRHAAIPKGFRTSLRVSQVANVLGRHRAFSCSGYFGSKDLSGAVKLAGRALPGIDPATVISSACSSARSARPYASEGAFRSALNARSGSVAFVRSAQVANEVNGTASFNYSVAAFSIIADRHHRFAACSFAAGTCVIRSGDTAVFRVAAPPAPRASPLQFVLAVTPSVAPRLPFKFFGIKPAGARFGPLLTTGP